MGILDESTLGELGNNGVYRLPYSAEFWALRGSAFAEDFSEVVERGFLPLSGTQIIIADRPDYGG